MSRRRPSALVASGLLVVGGVLAGASGPALAGPTVPVRAATVAADDASGTGSRLVVPRDPRLTETSGIVDRGSFVVLTNDSGSCACLSVVSTRTGRTVGVTRWRATTRDVEALAPAGPRAVWVGDIGDNDAVRRRLTLYRVPVAPGSRTVRAAAYALAYPRGAHDAESLVVDRQGRVVVVTKSFAGGQVFRTAGRPRAGRVNRLRPVGRVAELATDAALSRDGRVLVVRGPGSASAYAYPSLRRLGSFLLPPQRQGEGIAVGPGGRVLVAGEGVRSPVLRVDLPASVRARVAPGSAPAASPSATPSATPSPTPSPPATPSPSPSPAADDRADDGSGPPAWLPWTVPAVIVVGALGIGLGLRRRSPG